MKLKEIVESAWDNRENLRDYKVQEAIFEVVDQLDRECYVLPGRKKQAGK